MGSAGTHRLASLSCWVSPKSVWDPVLKSIEWRQAGGRAGGREGKKKGRKEKWKEKVPVKWKTTQGYPLASTNTSCVQTHVHIHIHIHSCIHIYTHMQDVNDYKCYWYKYRFMNIFSEHFSFSRVNMSIIAKLYVKSRFNLIKIFQCFSEYLYNFIWLKGCETSFFLHCIWYCLFQCWF